MARKIFKRENWWCDACDRVRTCYDEGRLMLFTTLSDMEFHPLFREEQACHAMLNIGQHCPKRTGEVEE